MKDGKKNITNEEQILIGDAPRTHVDPLVHFSEATNTLKLVGRF